MGLTDGATRVREGDPSRPFNSFKRGLGKHFAVFGWISNVRICFKWDMGQALGAVRANCDLQLFEFGGEEPSTIGWMISNTKRQTERLEDGRLTLKRRLQEGLLSESR